MKKQYNYTITAKFLSCIANIIIMMGFAGCKKSIDIGPPTTLIATANVYTSNTTAEAAVSGLFTYMASSSRMYNGASSVTLQLGLAADELQNFSSGAGGNTLFYTNSLSGQNNYYWPEIFTELYICNSTIAGLVSSTDITPAIQQQLLGEVKFARAFIFFNAVNLYGDVPLVLSADPTINNSISRSPAAAVLKQVIQDLTDAQNLLPDNKYLSFTGTVVTDRILPNKQTASALLARVYLYMQNWKDAETQASNVIGASTYLLEPVLTNVFLKASRETIWQLQSVSAAFDNADAYSLIMTGAPNGSLSIYPLSTSLVKSFETGDNRFTNWVGTIQAGATTYNFAYKYKQRLVMSGITVNEYPIMFRLAEQYLIRAEARAQQSNFSGAAADLNIIRARARQTPTSLPDYPATTSQSDLLTAIYHERRIELFTEFGHRWFDLKRTGQIDAVMSVTAPLKGGTWSSYKALIPLPQSEISINSHLSQNPGYN